MSGAALGASGSILGAGGQITSGIIAHRSSKILAKAMKASRDAQLQTARIANVKSAGRRIGILGTTGTDVNRGPVPALAEAAALDELRALQSVHGINLEISRVKAQGKADLWGGILGGVSTLIGGASSFKAGYNEAFPSDDLSAGTAGALANPQATTVQPSVSSFATVNGVSGSAFQFPLLGSERSF